MTTSPARIAANHQNALKSTGPKTPEGKAASRLNAFRHGMAGQGVLLGPGDDSKQVLDRAQAFARELGAVGEFGHLLAHRAALLSVRMEQSSAREMAVVASNVQDARDQFDQGRFEEFEGWVNDLVDPCKLRPALQKLETIPEGVAFLIASWAELRDQTQSNQSVEAQQAAQQASTWLGLSDANALRPGQTRRINDEIERLRAKASSPSMLDKGRAIDALRDEAGTIASFDPSPEAALAHRYEAAAERSMYRAIRALNEIRRAHNVDLAPIAPPSQSACELGSRPPGMVAGPVLPPPSLGSFRADVLAAASPEIKSMLGLIEPSILPAEPRKKRPDLRKLAASRR